MRIIEQLFFDVIIFQRFISVQDLSSAIMLTDTAYKLSRESWFLSKAILNLFVNSRLTRDDEKFLKMRLPKKQFDKTDLCTPRHQITWVTLATSRGSHNPDPSISWRDEEILFQIFFRKYNCQDFCILTNFGTIS